MYEPFREESGPARSTGHGGTDPASTERAGSGETLKEKAQQVAGEARGQVETSLDKGRRRAASTLSSVAQSLVQSSEQADGTTRSIVERAGREVQRFSDFIERTPPREMYTRAERFARQQPALFLGGAFVLGLVAARFLKSSASSEESERFRSREQMAHEERPRRTSSYDRDRSVPSYFDASAPEATLDYDAMRNPAPARGERSPAADYEQY
jgi:hypothetical protein